MNGDKVDIENVTGRELDAAVAKAMGWKQRVFEGQDPDSPWDDEAIFQAGVDAGLTHIDAEGRRSILPGFSSIRFSCVKREIERRGWGWSCERDCDPTLQFRFDVYVPTGRPGDYCKKHSAWAKSEGEAGCRAFLMAHNAGSYEEEQGRCPSGKTS